MVVGGGRNIAKKTVPKHTADQVKRKAEKECKVKKQMTEPVDSRRRERGLIPGTVRFQSTCARVHTCSRTREAALQRSRALRMLDSLFLGVCSHGHGTSHRILLMQLNSARKHRKLRSHFSKACRDTAERISC